MDFMKFTASDCLKFKGKNTQRDINADSTLHMMQKHHPVFSGKTLHIADARSASIFLRRSKKLINPFHRQEEHGIDIGSETGIGKYAERNTSDDNSVGIETIYKRLEGFERGEKMSE